MKRLSKLLVMVVVTLAVVTISLRVNAGTADLVTYVTKSHTINGMKFELKSEQKKSVQSYIEKNVSDAQADSAYAKIKSAEKIVADSGVTKIENLSASDKSKAISLATQAASDVGLTLKVDTNANTFTLLNGSTVLVSDAVKNLVKPVNSGSNGGSGSSSSAGTSTTGSSLLYTGSNSVVYGVVALAIVAVAVVVKKRA